MSTPDLNRQLAQLKQRIARIDRKYQSEGGQIRCAPGPRKAARFFIEEWASGEVVENDHGPHFQMEKLYEGHRHHGSADIGALAELPADLLGVLSETDVPTVSPERWAFLDTETTGLAGGSGTYAFLIGVGRITSRGFLLRQFFLREYAEEKSLLAALSQHLAEFDILVTYNGKTYDEPLLETRYRMNRLALPFERLSHIDLLHGSRRLWKLRLQNCRLTHIERHVLGVEREGDLPGELIPYVYFEYLRSGEAQRLVPIFHHNAIDILTLGCLAALVPAAFRSRDLDSLASLGFRKGEEYLGIGRWCATTGDPDRALALLNRAVALGLPDNLLFRTLWDIARLHKRATREGEALAVLEELAECRNPYQAQALIELSKHYEHRKTQLAQALGFAQRAQELVVDRELSEDLHRRISRLKRKADKAAAPRLL